MSQNKKQQRKQDRKSKQQKTNQVSLSDTLCPPQDQDSNSIESSSQQDSEDQKDQAPKATIDLLIDLFYKIQNWFILFLRICLVFSFLQKNIRSFFSTKPNQSKNVNNYNNYDNDHHIMSDDFSNNLGLQQMMKMHAFQGQQIPLSNLKTDRYFDDEDFDDDDDKIFFQQHRDAFIHSDNLAHLQLQKMHLSNPVHSVDESIEFPDELLESVQQIEAGSMKQLKKQRPPMNRVNSVIKQITEPIKIQGSPYEQQQAIDSNLNLKMIENSINQQPEIDECQYDYSSVNTLKLTNDSITKCFFELSHIIDDSSFEIDPQNSDQLILDDDFAP